MDIYHCCVIPFRYLPEASNSPIGGKPMIDEADIKAFPPWLYLFCRTTMLLRGICFALDMDVNLSEMWRPFAEQTLRGDVQALYSKAAVNAAIDSGSFRMLNA